MKVKMQINRLSKVIVLILGGFAFLSAFLIVQDAQARQIKNKVAVFAALNKVTARISHLEIPIDGVRKFGALTIKPRVCNTTPATEAPSTTSFIEVKERKLDGSQAKLFSGWVFAENPGIHAVEHPVYDVWLTSCKMPLGGVAVSKPKKLQRRRTRVRSRRR
ncbi:MAG: DUF2155 domain-containing protein [Rhodomicrobiaceae bacterium]